jgi:hypothetical protein
MSRTWMKYLAAGAFALGLTNTANAGTIEPEMMAPVAAPMKVWNDGFYAGVVGGTCAVHGDHDLKRIEFTNTANGLRRDVTSVNANAGMGCGTISGVFGWGMDLAKWFPEAKDFYVGVEGSLGWDSSDDDLLRLRNNIVPVTNVKTAYERGFIWSVAARLGWKPAPTTMLYVRLGVQGHREELSARNNSAVAAGRDLNTGLLPGKSFSKSEHNIGFNPGVGIETRLFQADNIDVNGRVQYDFVTADSVTRNVVWANAAGGNVTNNHRVKMYSHYFQVGVTANFGNFGWM